MDAKRPLCSGDGDYYYYILIYFILFFGGVSFSR